MNSPLTPAIFWRNMCLTATWPIALTLGGLLVLLSISARFTPTSSLPWMIIYMLAILAPVMTIPSMVIRVRMLNLKKEGYVEVPKDSNIGMVFTSVSLFPNMVLFRIVPPQYTLLAVNFSMWWAPLMFHMKDVWLRTRHQSEVEVEVAEDESEETNASQNLLDGKKAPAKYVDEKKRRQKLKKSNRR